MCSSPGGTKASRMSVPQQQSPMCEGTSGLKAGMFNCSMALSPAQRLAEQGCSGGVMSTSVPALTELSSQSYPGSHPLHHLAPAEPPGSSVSPGNAFKE